MKKSFTLIELIVVIGIIALLSGLGASAYNGFQQSARDQRRKNDLETISNALQAYYAANGKYPQATNADNSTCTYGLSCRARSSQALVDGSGNPRPGRPWIEELVPEFIDELPIDPYNTPANGRPWLDNGYVYTYGNVDANGQVYDLTARLENTNDPDRSTIQNYRYYHPDTNTFYFYNTQFSATGGQVYEFSPGS